MDEIKYLNLFELINDKNNLELIKSKYIELLKELTNCDNISTEIFVKNLSVINNSGLIIIAYIGSFELNTFDIIGSGTIYIEPKIIRQGKSVGHIEDIVVKSDYRGKKIAQNILNRLKDFALNSNCYKVILDCDEKVSNVYKSNGFEIKGLQMAQYFF